MPRREGWEYYVYYGGDGKGNTTAECTFCHLTNYGEYNEMKYYNHIISCKKCPAKVKKKLKRCYPSVNSEQIASTSKQNFDSVSSTLSNMTISNEAEVSSPINYTQQEINNEKSTANLSISEMVFNQCNTPKISDEEKSSIDTLLARAIYDSGVSFDSLQSNTWKEAIMALKPNYEIPTPSILRTSLLEAEYDHTINEIISVISKSSSLGLMLNVYPDKDGNRLIDFIVTTPKPLLFTSVKFEYNSEMGKAVLETVDGIFADVSENEFVALITGDPTDIQDMLDLFKQKYPNISIVTCSTRSINLLTDEVMNEVAKYKNGISFVYQVVKYIMDSEIVRDYFEKVQEDEYKQNKQQLKLSAGVENHWVGNVEMLETFLSNREALEVTVNATELNFDEHLKNTISSKEIWETVTEILNILTFIKCKIEKLESCSAFLSDVPAVFSSIEEEITKKLLNNGISKEAFWICHKIIKYRCYSAMSPIHYAANILDPKYNGKSLSISNISIGLQFLFDYPAFVHLDRAVVNKCLVVYDTIASLVYGRIRYTDTLQEISPIVWWNGLHKIQVLHKVAIDILSIPPTVSVPKKKLTPLNDTQKFVTSSLSTCEEESKLRVIRGNLRLIDNTLVDLSLHKIVPVSQEELNTIFMEFTNAFPQFSDSNN